jgi:hypothetical protein
MSASLVSHSGPPQRGAGDIGIGDIDIDFLQGHRAAEPIGVGPPAGARIADVQAAGNAVFIWLRPRGWWGS